ncbi:MAG: transcriptional regulator [Verrucomicrobia bacterium]|nr:transcriptional regulator [Verrucomicrobiota bacterium]
MENLDRLVKELCKQPKETGWLEFKRNYCDPRMVGEDISALANSSVVAGRDCAYMLWGIEDGSHDIVGTSVRLAEEKVGNQELESWLRCMLSKNADFQMYSLDIDDKHVEVLIIGRAVGTPVAFDKIDYIRVGSYTKKLRDYSALQAQLWDRLRGGQFEDICALEDLTFQDLFKLLHLEAYFDVLSVPMPTTPEGSLHYLKEDGIIKLQDNGLYSVTNVGALLFAKRLSDFPRIGRKAIRIVQYDGSNRVTILKEEVFDEGYAVSFEKAVKLVSTLLPLREDINSVRRVIRSGFPLLAIREAIANAIVHQDFFVTGASPIVEIFDGRIEITNPGTPLINIMRIVDNPPKSRNEKLATLMRRLGVCEELGRGWDRMVISCELLQLSAPRIEIYEDSTRVVLSSFVGFSRLTQEDKRWSTYLHACIKFMEGGALSNASLRQRFGLQESSSGSISRLIKLAVSGNLLKPLDANTAPRYMKYVPIWA